MSSIRINNNLNYQKILITLTTITLKSVRAPCDEKYKQTDATQVVYLIISNIFLGTVSM